MNLKNEASPAMLRATVWMAAVLGLLAIASNKGIFTTIIAVSLIISAASLYWQLRGGEAVAHDERTHRLTRSAAAGSWIATFALIAGLAIADGAGIARFSAREVLGATFLFMALSFSGLSWYFERKGDVK